MDFLRSQCLKIKYLPPSLEAYYKSLQDDYKNVLAFLVEHSGMGHLVWVEDEPRIVEPKLPSGNLAELLVILKKGGTPASNCYGIFYEDKKSLSRPKKNSKEHKFASSLATLDAENFEKRVEKYDALPKNDWLYYSDLLKKGSNFDELWDKEIAERIGNPNKGVNLVPKVKKLFPKIKEPRDHDYCTALMSMVVSSFSSWVKCHDLHMEETAAMEQQLKEKIAEHPDVYEQLLNFSNALEQHKYGLSLKVLKKSLHFAKTNLGAEAFYAIPFAEIQKYSLLSADEKAVLVAYKALKIYWRLRNRKKYISMPRMKDYQVPFGLTGRGMRFNITCVNGVVTVAIGGQHVVCYPSHYFHDLSIKQDKWFEIAFRHKLKDKKKEVYGDWIKADLKEIKILKKEDEYFLYLPYTIHHPDDNFKLQKFFMQSTPQAVLEQNGKYCLYTPKEKFTFDSIQVAGFDLNLSTPITATKTTLVDGKVDPQNTVSEILCKNTSLSQQIRTLRNKFVTLTDVIRSYKKSVKNNVPLSEEDSKWIDTESGVVGSYRYKLQKIIAKVKAEERRFKYKCRKNGHNNLSENIRLLELMDAAFSLRKCYDNIHIFDVKKCIYTLSDRRRDNFRDFVSKQFGHIVAQYCKDANVNVAFLEDLDLRGDFDNDTNSLSRLFAAGQLKKAVQQALEKYGIGCVFVPCAGTSRVDPATAMVGYRDEMDKTKLYVLRENKLGKVHCDLAASLNVLLVGLSHSIYPYKVWVNKDGKVKEGKRIKAFLSKSKFKLPKNYSGWAYATPKGFWTEEQKKTWVERIKQLSKTAQSVEDFALNGNTVNAYKAFTID